jgi:mannose/fructose/N-acetylgalactosamine-specific phosphotransferase system component IIC
MKSSIGAIILQLLGGIIPFAIFYWGFGLAIWLSIVLAVLVVGILMAIWETYLRKQNPV